MSRFATVKIRGQGLRTTTFEVNGQDVSAQVRAVRFDHAANDVPRFVLDFYSDDFEIEGDGIVYVERGGSIADFLRNVDAAALEQAVLQRAEWGSSTVQNVLNLLVELTDGG